MSWPECKGQDAHCSHFKSRAYASVRWFPDNAVLLCAAHHDYASKNPDEHTETFRRLLGPTRYDWLIERFRRVFRYRKADKAAMRKHFGSELERLKAARAAGAVGPLEFAAYD